MATVGYGQTSTVGPRFLTGAAIVCFEIVCGCRVYSIEPANNNLVSTLPSACPSSTESTPSPHTSPCILLSHLPLHLSSSTCIAHSLLQHKRHVPLLSFACKLSCRSTAGPSRFHAISLGVFTHCNGTNRTAPPVGGCSNSPLSLAAPKSGHGSKTWRICPQSALTDAAKYRRLSTAWPRSRWTKRKLSIGESNPGLPRLTRSLLTSGNHDH